MRNCPNTEKMDPNSPTVKIREILYIPDPTQDGNVTIGVILQSSTGEYLVRRRANWNSVLALDPVADLDFLRATLQDCVSDPKRFLSLLDTASASIQLTKEHLLPTEEVETYVRSSLDHLGMEGSSAC